MVNARWIPPLQKPLSRSRCAAIADHELAFASIDSSDWTDDERLLIRMVDELHDTASLCDETWSALAAAFSVEQILELIGLVGFYHTVAFFANSLKLPPEPLSVPFPTA